MSIAETRSVIPMSARALEARDFHLEAAKAALVAAFRDRVTAEYPEAASDAEGRRKGWQHDAAGKIGVSQPIVSELWRGEPKDMQLSTLLRIQRWIGRPLDEILGIARLSETPPPRTTVRPKVR